MGEGNGTPLQYSCVENPMDGGAWKEVTWLRQLQEKGCGQRRGMCQARTGEGVLWGGPILSDPWAVAHPAPLSIGFFR